MGVTAIIGAGLTGAWTAYLLASRGREVVIYDDFSLPFRASDHNPGGVNPLHGPCIPGRMEAFQLACHQLHLDHGERISDLSGIDYQLRIIDRLFVAFSDTDVAELRAMQGLYEMAAGFDAVWLDAPQVRFLEPRISAEIQGGLLTRGNGVVDSQRYNQALLAAALQLGARHQSANPRSLVRDGGKVTHIEVKAHRQACDAVVIANGCWTTDVFAQLDFPVSVSPVKGQMLTVRIPGRAFDWDITHGLTGLYQYRDDLYWLGGTREDPAVDAGPTPSGKQHILGNIRHMLPGVAGIEVVSHTAGYRPGSPDGLPLVGRLPGFTNVYTATGAGSKGVLLCSGMAAELVDLIQGGGSHYDFLSPARLIPA